jgi:hypothetical protein
VTGSFRSQKEDGSDQPAYATVSLQFSDYDQWTILQSNPVTTVPILGDGTWAEFDAEFQLGHELVIPPGAWKVLVKINVGGDRFLIQRMSMEHIGDATYAPSSTPSDAPSEMPSISLGNAELFPLIQAESYIDQFGVQPTSGGSGTVVGWTDIGDWMRYKVYFGSMGQTNALDIRYSKSTSGGLLEVRLGGPTGRLVGEFAPVYTGRRWRNYVTASIQLANDIEGFQDVYMVVSGANGLANLDWYQFKQSL